MATSCSVNISCLTCALFPNSSCLTILCYIKVSVHLARSIIVLANHQSPDQSDATVLRIVLSLVAIHDQHKEIGGLKVTRDMSTDQFNSFEVNMEYRPTFFQDSGPVVMYHQSFVGCPSSLQFLCTHWRAFLILFEASSKILLHCNVNIFAGKFALFFELGYLMQQVQFCNSRIIFRQGPNI